MSRPLCNSIPGNLKSLEINLSFGKTQNSELFGWLRADYRAQLRNNYQLTTLLTTITVKNLLKLAYQYFFSLSICLCSTLAIASALRELEFNQQFNKAGLETQNVSSIAQDNSGYLWICSETGLFRYDGWQFLHYGKLHAHNQNLANQACEAVYFIPSSKQLVVLSRDNRLFLQDPITKRFNEIFLSIHGKRLKPDRITALKAANNEHLWLASSTGLFSYHLLTGETRYWPHVFGETDTAAASWIESIELDQQNNLWLGGKPGLSYLKLTSMTFHPYQFYPELKNSDSANAVNTIFRDSQNRIWVGLAKGLWRLPESADWQERQRINLPSNFYNARIKTITEGQTGEIWVIVRDRGIFRLTAEATEFYQNNQFDQKSLADNQAETIFKDAQGALWIGYWSEGLGQIITNKPGFARYLQIAGQPDSLPNAKINTLIDLNSQDLLLGSFGGGLIRLDKQNGKATTYKPDQALTSKVVLQLKKYRENQTLIINEDGLWLDNKQGQKLLLSSAKHPWLQHATALQSDQNQLWIGSSNGLYLYDLVTTKLQSWTYVDGNKPGLISNLVNSIYLDKHHQLWIATDRGLQVFDLAKSSWQSVDGISNLNATVFTIFEDHQENIWVGGIKGISKIGRQQQGYVSAFNLPLRAAVNCLLDDEDGNLWISLDNGIAYFNPNQAKLRYFSASDGLIEGGYYTNACAKDQAGQLYFGGIKGLSKINPKRLKLSDFNSKVIINELKIDNTTVYPEFEVHGFLLKTAIEDSQRLELEKVNNSFSLGFTTLELRQPSQQRFRYRLQGYRDEWLEVDGAQRFANFSNLAAGKYLFQVQAGNSDGDWSDQIKQLEIIVKPSWTENPWFLLLVFIGIIGLFYLVNRLNFKLLISKQKRLEQEVEKRTITLKSQSELLEKQSLELQSLVQVLKEKNQQEILKKGELSRFLAVASHDLRQPLYALNLYLKSLVKLDLNEKVRHLTFNIQQCTLSMNSMFNSLFDLSRLDANVVAPEIIDFSLLRLLEKIQTEFALLAQEKNLHFHIDSQEIWVRTDPDLLEQILRNLLVNAIRYTHQGEVSLSAKVSDQTVLLSVNDTGIGIEEKYRLAIFNEFFQVQKNDEAAYKGMGLGLAIVQRLSQLLGIQVELDTAPGAGCRFTLSLKVGVSVNQTKLGTTHTLSEKLKFLIIIDDDTAVLDATQVLFMEMGIATLAVQSFEELTERLAEEERIPDLIISDYYLDSQSNGIQIIEFVREQYCLDIPALIVTGEFKLDQSLTKLKVLFKPVTAEILIAEINRIIEA